MLEYFAFKKVKKHREEKAEKARAEEETKKEPTGTATAAAAAATTAATTTVATPVSPLSPSSASPFTVSEPDHGNSKALMPVDGTPLLDHDDQDFLERLTSSRPQDGGAEHSDEPGNRPPLPPRTPTPAISWDSDGDSLASKAEGGREGVEKNSGEKTQKEQENADDTLKQKNKRFSVLTNLARNVSLRRKAPGTGPGDKDKGKGKEGSKDDGLNPSHLAVPANEAAQEEIDMARVLDDLNLTAQNNRAFSLSAESADMVSKFTLVLKDIVNGAPTAYSDLTNLLEDRDGILARNYERLPKGLKKLVTQLPTKLSSTLAPELLAVAAESQGLKPDAAAQGGGQSAKDAAKAFLTPKNLQELVTKPGAIAGLLRGIVNALKVRWPAFIGTNVLWSVALFLLLSVLWYCHKRGREVRLEKEAAAAAAGQDPIDGRERIEELPDDPQLPAPTGSALFGQGSGGSALGSTGEGAGRREAEAVPVWK